MKEEDKHIMKFAVETTDLSQAVITVSKACATKTIVSVLECIKISAYNDVLTLLATDGELSIQEKIRAEVLEEGEICVPGKTFTDFICKLPDRTITVNTCEKGIEIKYEDSVSYIQALGAEEFPKLNFDINENNFVVNQKKFKDLVARTTFCCATDDSRPLLKGCLVEAEGEEITLTALDGYRLAVGKENLVSASGNLKIICPCRTLLEISKMLTGEEENIAVYTAGGMMMIRIGETILTSRLYQGEFINRHSIIPKEFTTRATVKKADIEDSIGRASVLIKGDKNNLIIMDIKNGAIRITSNSDMGGVDEKVEADIEGKELKIAMNSKFVYDAVKAMGSEEVVFGFNSAIAPFVCTERENKDYLYLILPVRTTS